jgi:hypothetical protein
LALASSSFPRYAAQNGIISRKKMKNTPPPTPSWIFVQGTLEVPTEFFGNDGDGRAVLPLIIQGQHPHTIEKKVTPVERLPTPVCKCFVLCRELIFDPARQDYTIVSPVHQVLSRYYPLTEDFCVFARWTNAHGSYAVEVQLRNLEGDVLSSHKMEAPFETRDPLQIWILPLQHLRMQIPAPGKYEVAILANGAEVASDTLLAHQFGPEG